MNYDQNIQFYPYVASWLNDYIINSWKQEQFLLSLLFIFPIHWVQCSAHNEVAYLTFTKMKLLWNLWLPPPLQKILISISEPEHKLPLSLWPNPLRFIPLNNCIVTIYKALCYYDDAYIIGRVSNWGWLSWSAARPLRQYRKHSMPLHFTFPLVCIQTLQVSQTYIYFMNTTDW